MNLKQDRQRGGKRVRGDVIGCAGRIIGKSESYGYGKSYGHGKK